MNIDINLVLTIAIGILLASVIKHSYIILVSKLAGGHYSQSIGGSASSDRPQPTTNRKRI